MPYEVDFHPVSEGAKSGDAITLRYWDGAAWRVMMIDGGYQETGPKLRDHIRSFYQTNRVDHVVSTHPDNDHVGGLKTILSEMDVGTFWTHIPELHAPAIIGLFNSSRWQVDNLATALRQAYPMIGELRAIARDRQISVQAPFQGARIGPFTVLSPTVPMYNGLLPQFRDTPDHNQTLLGSLGVLITGVGRRVSRAINYVVRENWQTETLREGGTTAAENESSVVLYGDLGGGPFLLTADAGLIALSTAARYAEANGLPLGRALRLFQVPHHGSRNNVSPSILDRIVGPILQPSARHQSNCVISAGPDDETHPRQVVVNALVRRGLEPCVTRTGIICFALGMPQGRSGWGPAASLSLSTQVEQYD